MLPPAPPRTPRLLGQLAKKEALEKKLAELRGESSGLPEGPEGKVKVRRLLFFCDVYTDVLLREFTE